MVGVKQFDEGRAIDTVMRTFWTQGYNATSMADLAQATGVQRGSLYHAYGGKDALMLRALDHYATEQGRVVRTAIEAQADLHGAVRAFLEAHIARMADPANPAGCLMCRTAMECMDEPPIADRVRAQFLRTETVLLDAFREGQAKGALPADTDARALARFFLGVSRGMAVLHQVYGAIGPVQDMARTALGVLPRAAAECR